MMRVDFDRYVADLPREARAGRAGLARGAARPFTPAHREESTRMSEADRGVAAPRREAARHRAPVRTAAAATRAACGSS